MSSYRSRGVDRHAAERLLAGEPAAVDAARPLAAVLRVAAAPAYPEELTGERAALTAFRDAAQLDHVPEPRRPSMIKSTLAKILTVKVAAILAAASTTGVVLAATSGALPTPWTETPADPPAVASSKPAEATPSGRPSDAGKPADPGGDPSPSMVGLCKAYEAKVGTSPGKALDSPAFTALVEAANGAENVPEYCDAVAAAADDPAAEHPDGKPTDLPTPTDPGNGHAGDPPSSRPQTPSSRAHAPVSPATGTPTAVPPDGATPAPGN
ncbi:MAG: hypothetical protein GEV28_11090 [Actinophytocola sp.]|uniref:hypothetical protein n=1 Tax=Actinophytocola sp. TaxID=1872138 RepID=UPI0013275A87|nr:hypothetical protein [Actinophytocola sp.]MPZ80901.1 hypothetical protein [Actinophytocola sp.]